MKIHSIQLAVRSKISSKLIFASCVWYSDRAYYELCVLMKDIGRRLPLQLQCSYQGQQDDFSQSVRGNYKTRFWGGQNLTAVYIIYDFTPLIFAVPMWGSEVAESKKTEIHLVTTPSEVTWACDVTTIERKGDFTLLV